MEQAEFEAIVARLESKSWQGPAASQTKVALLALLGFVILALVIGTAGTSLLALLSVPYALWIGGMHELGALVGVGKPVLLLAVPVWFFVKSTLAALLTRLSTPQGLELRRDEAPGLFAAIEALRHKMKGKLFHHVLVTYDLNAEVAPVSRTPYPVKTRSPSWPRPGLRTRRSFGSRCWNWCVWADRRPSSHVSSAALRRPSPIGSALPAARGRASPAAASR